MITKLTYDIYRKSEELPIFIIYDYYLENKKPEKEPMTIEAFNTFFPQFVQRYQGLELIYSDGSRRLIDFSIIAYYILKFYEDIYYPIEEYEIST